MNQKSAVIGVMPLWDAQRESYWMVPGYLQGLEQQGAVPLMLPLTDAPRELDYFLESCDGFLLTGGQDLDPAQYGQQDTGLCGETCPLRDRMDRYILTQAVERGKAVLGICRGLQLMNAAYGGTRESRGSWAKSTRSPSLPGSREPTRSWRPQMRAAWMVIASRAACRSIPAWAAIWALSSR